MSKHSTQINKLIDLLAEQLRIAESFREAIGSDPDDSLVKAEACRAASKIVSQLETIGITFKESFIKAEEINEAHNNQQSDKLVALKLIENNL